MRDNEDWKDIQSIYEQFVMSLFVIWLNIGFFKNIGDMCYVLKLS